MEFLQLKYFQHAARTENFSHTAVAFTVPVSSVSSTIKKLEQELGVTLFNRKSNKLTLNENGKLFLKTVDTVFEELNKAKNSIADISGTPGGKINILIDSNRSNMMKLISDFRNKYPKTSFTIRFGEKSFTDFDIIVSDRIIENHSFECADFIDEEILLAVHKSNPLSKRKQVDMRMLGQEKFLCLYKNQSIRTLTDKLWYEAGIEPDISIECDDPQCLRDCLDMGMGVCIFPSVSWKDYISPSISLVKINNGVFRSTKIYTNKNSSESTRVFLRHAREYIAAL